jgi:hypothetical protein
VLAAEYSIYIDWHEIDTPLWADILIVLAIAGAIAAAVMVWRSTRRKGPPPLPRR